MSNLDSIELKDKDILESSDVIKNFIKYSKVFESLDDYKLEVSNEYIEIIFPNSDYLTSEDIDKFKSNKVLRKNVVKCYLRMLLFYGFILDKKEIIIQQKPLNRVYKGKTIGLYSIHNYDRITQIMKFLIDINMEYLSVIFFLCMCKAIKSDYVLYKKVIDTNSLKKWIKTQPYLKEYKIDNLWLGEKQLEKIKKCQIYGLNYTGNSCYMDSALICTFAIPNKTITDNILEKNLDMLKDIKIKLWNNCDIKYRKNIQKALNDITMSMRGGDNVKNCSNLRSMIKKCPGSQPFHGTNTQDSGEFLSYIFNIFQVDVAHTYRKTYGSNDLQKHPKWTLVREQKDNNTSPIVDVVSTRLLEIKDDYDITKFIKQKEDSILDESDKWTPDKSKPHINYIRRKEIFKVKSSPIVIFNLTRTYGEPIYDKKGNLKSIKTSDLWKKITAPESFNLNHKNLYLTGIVVHTGGVHYIANIKCNGEWYWYDDNPGSSKHIIKHIGSYEKMLKTKPYPLTHGTLFFYTSLQNSKDIIIQQETHIGDIIEFSNTSEDDIKDITCNAGLVTEEKYDIYPSSHSNNNIGEFDDVYCVANGKKPLAALDFSSYGINKFRKLNIDKINKVIKYANSKGIQALHNKKTGGMYLKTVFFLPTNYNNALKLMKILWDNEGLTNEEMQYMIGKLLGYTINNIKYFMKKNYNIIISDEQIKIFQDKLDRIQVTLNELQKNNQIIKMDNIKYI